MIKEPDGSWNEEGWKEALFQLEVMQKVPELVVHDRMSQGKGVKDVKEKKKVPVWSTEEMREKLSIAVVEVTDEMRKWRGFSRSEKDQCWENWKGSMEKDVLDKYEVEDSKGEAFRGRGAPLKWRRVRRSKNDRIQKWREDCWARIFALLRKYNLQRLQSKQEESTEEEEMKQQQRMKIMKDLTKKISQKKEWTLKADGGFLSCWRQTVRKRGITHDGKTPSRNAQTQGGANDQKCGRKCGSLAQHLQAYSMEGRGADLGK